MNEIIQDAMSYVRKYGTPDLFITMTCNPKWIEIIDQLYAGQQPQHRHDIIARVFELKIKAIMHLIQKVKIFGEVKCHMYTNEWQKRGLPHMHLLLWLQEKIRPNQVDDVICAELPDPKLDPQLYKTVVNSMVHNPCTGKKRAKCKIGDKCSKGYPKAFTKETQTGEDGYPRYRRRKKEDGGQQFEKYIDGEKFTITNEWIVPYSPLLSKLFDCHINVEYCQSIKAIKYVCKYINKGSDLAVMGLEDVNKEDEIACYQTARYISTNEACWKLFGFNIHHHHPPVVQMAVHIENGQRVQFNPDDPRAKRLLSNPPPRSTLTAFFDLNANDNFAKTLLYPEIPEYYVWDKASKTWRRRKRDGGAIGRVYIVHPNKTDCFHVRLLLHNVRGPTSFEDLRTVEGEICESYQKACSKLGLLEDDEQWDKTLTEIAESYSADHVRTMFATILACCRPSNPEELWEKHKASMCEDLLHKAKESNPHIDIVLTDAIINEGLILLENKLMLISGITLSHFKSMPDPDRSNELGIDQDYIRETSYETDQDEIQRKEDMLLPEQKIAFDSICAAVESQDGGGIFFIDAPGGTGKTFLLNLILARIRHKNMIALAVASSGIAATLLDGGRTAHSTLKLPLTKEEELCYITKQSSRANLLKQTQLIVWDECTMAHRSAVEAVDKTLKDFKNTDRLMGGITFVFAGDFRQTLPVIPKGTKADELDACLQECYFWKHVRVLKLTKNMRTHVHGDDTAEAFAKDLLKIGNGRLPLDSSSKLHVLPCGIAVKDIDELTESVFPNLEENLASHEWLFQRAILAPRNDAVESINIKLLRQLSVPEHTYKSFDKVCDGADFTKFPLEFLNSLQPPGVPPHNLILKVGAPIMMLRNIRPPQLVNGTRMSVKACRQSSIEAIILSGTYKGETVHIPRIPIEPNDCPIRFTRTQFPVRLAFAMSINKSQGQTLKVVGLQLEKPCFSHGQLYVGCSRVSSSDNLFVCTGHGTDLRTENVVYKEALTTSRDETSECSSDGWSSDADMALDDAAKTSPQAPRIELTKPTQPKENKEKQPTKMVNPKSAPKRKVDEKDTRVNNVGGSKAGIKNLRNRSIAIAALETVLVTDQPVKKKGNVKDAVKKIAKKSSKCIRDSKNFHKNCSEDEEERNGGDS